MNVGIEVYHGENKVTRTGATSGAGAAFPSGALVFILDISVARSLPFCVVFYNSLIVLFSLFFCWSLYCVFLIVPFGIFKLSSDIHQEGKWWYYEECMGRRCDYYYQTWI